MTDERFDQHVLSVLGWHADRVAADQPTVREATRTLAARLGPSAATVRPRLTLAPATAAGLNMVWVLLLLLLALGAALAVGSLLLRDNRPQLPAPFGLAGGYCGSPLVTGDILSFGIQDNFRRLNLSGSLHSDPLIPENPDESELSRTEYVESAAYLERRLTQRGVDLLRERVETLGLEPGCRSVQTRESSGAVYMRSEEGVVGLTWYPYEARSPNIGQYGLLRRATVEEEETLAELSADLSDMEAWLPPDAWTDPLESRVQPETWLVVITLSDSIKSSAQYTQISLPGGVEPGDFGTEILVEAYDVAEATETRCGLIGRSDALALAESLDESGRPSWIRVLAGIPGGVDCDWYEDQDAASRASAEPTPFVDGEFANFDVCSLVSRSAADAISAADPQMIPRRGLGRLGETWDPSCEVMDAAVMGARANVMLHSRRVSASEAEPLALQLLGGATLEEVIAGESVWINECLADDLPCWWGVVASSDPYLIVITMDARDDITTDDARDLVRSILEALDARD